MKIKKFWYILMLLCIPASAQAGLRVEQPESLTSGLVGHWTFDGPDISGTTAYDTSGLGNNGTISGALKKAGKLGQGMNFSQSGDYVNVGNSANLELNTGGTISVWIYPRSDGVGSENYGRIVDKSTDGDGANGYVAQMRASANQLAMEMSASYWADTTAGSVPYNQWTHFVWTFDGTSWIFYINGNFDKNYVTNRLPPAVVGNVFIGNKADNPNQTFDGTIDDVRVYSRALSANEVKRLYNMGRSTKISYASPQNTCQTTCSAGYFSSGGTALNIDSRKAGYTFSPTSTGKLTQVDLYLYKYPGTTNDVVVELWSVTANNAPSAKVASLGTFPASSIDSSYDWRTLNISDADQPMVIGGTTYALVLYGSGGSGDYATNQRCLSPNKYGQIYYDGSSWNPYYGAKYQIYIGGSKDSCSNETLQGSSAYQTSSNNWIAAKFTPSTGGSLTSIAVEAYLYPGSYAGITVKLYSDSSNKPGTLIANLGRIPYTSMDQTYSWRTLSIGSPPTVTSGTPYWLVYYKDNTDGSGDIAMNSGYSSSLNMSSTDSGTTWSYMSHMYKTYVAKKSIMAKTPTTTLNTGLVGHWTFDGPDISGTTVYDRSGQGHNGTMAGPPLKVIGKMGQGLKFNGTSDYISADDAAFGFDETSNFTISAWIYPKSVAAGYRHIGGNTYGNYRFFQVGDTVTLQLASANMSLSSGSVLAINNWYHVAAVYSSSKNAYVYVNGVLKNSDYDGTLDWSAQSIFRIGKPFDNAYYFDGTIDDVRVYSRALSAEEVKRLYNMGH